MRKRKKIIADTTELDLVIPTQEDMIKFNDEKGFPNCIDGKLHKWRKIKDCESEEDEELSMYDLRIDAKVTCEHCKLDGIGSFRLFMVIQEDDDR